MTETLRILLDEQNRQWVIEHVPGAAERLARKPLFGLAQKLRQMPEPAHECSIRLLGHYHVVAFEVDPGRPAPTCFNPDSTNWSDPGDTPDITILGCWTEGDPLRIWDLSSWFNRNYPNYLENMVIDWWRAQ